MSPLFYFYLAAVLAAVLLATVAIWAPRRTVPRAAALVVAVTLIPASYVALTEILGRPKPVAHEWWSNHVREAVLLGPASMRGGQSISGSSSTARRGPATTRFRGDGPWRRRSRR